MDEGDSGRKREAVQESAPPPKKKRLFIRELKYMMHGFGDDPNPHTGIKDVLARGAYSIID